MYITFIFNHPLLVTCKGTYFIAITNVHSPLNVIVFDHSSANRGIV